MTQPYREPFTIELPNKVRLRFDPNGIADAYAVSIFTRQGARISGFFPLADLGRLADQINAEIMRVEAAREPEEGTWSPGPDACSAGNVVFQCPHGEPQGGCKCMGTHEVVVMPCPEDCPAGRN